MIASVVRQSSHDQLTRLLSRAAWKGQALLNRAVRKLFGQLSGGYLLIDDTVITKHFSKVVSCVFWVFSSKEKRTVRGINLVALCWTNGAITLPLAFRIWQKDDKSKCRLARELLRYAKETLNISPKYVLFDSYYASREILKCLDAYRWQYVTQMKRNRLFNGKPVTRWKQQPYWIERGRILDGDITIARHGKKYFATNDHALTSAQMRAVYKFRWKIEEVFRFLHGKLGMDDCQARSTVAQGNHIMLCCLAAVLVEGERQARTWTRYQLKRKLSLQRERYHFIVLKPFFEGA